MRKALVHVKNPTFRETPYFGPVYYKVNEIALLQFCQGQSAGKNIYVFAL